MRMMRILWQHLMLRAEALAAQAAADQEADDVNSRAAAEVRP
jgi:hypothetical protein